VVINGRVEGNVTTGSQYLTLGSQGQVGGSLLGGAQDLLLQGQIGRGVTAGAGTLQIAGAVGVAGGGSLYLALASGAGAGAARHAFAVTTLALAAAALVGMVVAYAATRPASAVSAPR
jgi:hypothetical protein